jgi:single-strand DNA-binding protein
MLFFKGGRMASFNRVFLIGNLTRDPEMRYTASGQGVTTFSIAVNRVFKLSTGEKKEETTFIRVVVWGKSAESCHKYLVKGSSVFVEGRIQTRTWKGQDGQDRTTTEVVAINVQFLARLKETPQRGEEISEMPTDELGTDISPSTNKDVPF